MQLNAHDKSNNRFYNTINRKLIVKLKVNASWGNFTKFVFNMQFKSYVKIWKLVIRIKHKVQEIDFSIKFFPLSNSIS